MRNDVEVILVVLASVVVDLRDVDESWNDFEISIGSVGNRLLRRTTARRQGVTLTIVATHVTGERPQYGRETVPRVSQLSICCGEPFVDRTRPRSCGIAGTSTPPPSWASRVLDTPLLNERQLRVDSTAVSRSSVSPGLDGVSPRAWPGSSLVKAPPESPASVRQVAIVHIPSETELIEHGAIVLYPRRDRAATPRLHELTMLDSCRSAWLLPVHMSHFSDRGRSRRKTAVVRSWVE